METPQAHPPSSDPRQPIGLADPRLKLVWSNPHAPAVVLIAKAVERRSFDLILLAAWEHGVDAVAAVVATLRQQQALPVSVLDFADRALCNITIGAARAQSARAH